MTIEQLKKYCKSIGLVENERQEYYGFQFPSKYASLYDFIVAYDKKLNGVRCAENVVIEDNVIFANRSLGKGIRCYGFTEPLKNVKDIKEKMDNLIKTYKKCVLELKKDEYIDRISKIEGDFV
ncbi:MAG: hypothetical protein J6T10_14995 [Methanobrevibacter sp.]|nr:hypothetical protein [Methanobrevibacter sp.]